MTWADWDWGCVARDGCVRHCPASRAVQLAGFSFNYAIFQDALKLKQYQPSRFEASSLGELLQHVREGALDSLLKDSFNDSFNGRVARALAASQVAEEAAGVL